MKLYNLLLKIWVIPFYKQNAGFFLFFFFLFFGTVSPGSLVSYHLSLIQSILSSYTILGSVVVLWLCYNYKCINFIYSSIKKEEGRFLYQLQALPLSKQLLLFSLLETLLFSPIVLYIIVVICIAGQQGRIIQAVVLLAFVLSVCLGSSIYFCRLINLTWGNSKPLVSLKASREPKPQNLTFILFHYLVQDKKKPLLLLKLLSFIAIYIPLVWNGDRYDHDSLVLFLLVILLAHTVLAFQFVTFIERDLSFIRNLPIQPIRIFLIYLIAVGLLFLPELVYLLQVGQSLIGTTYILAIYLTLVNTSLLFTTVQYSGTIDRNEFVKIIFGIGFVSIFFFNSEQYTLWAGLTFLIAALLFCSSYNNYEPPIES